MSFLSFGRKKSKKEMISKLRIEKELLEESDKISKKRIEDLDGEKRALKQDIQRLETINRELSNKLHTEEPYEKIFNDRQDLIQNNSVKDSKIQELEGERKELNETIENLKFETKTLKVKYDTISLDLENERHKLEEMAKEKQNLELKIDEFEKEKNEYEEEITQLKDDFDKIRLEKEAWDRTKEEKQTEDKSTNTDTSGYMEATRQEISEYKSRSEDLRLASEALKSENEALFRANESKAKEINEIKNDLSGIKQELVKEQLKHSKLVQEWEEEKRGTEFVLVSKSARGKSRSRHSHLMATKEENDSEDEHILGLVESARAEAESLREKERAYRKRISELQTDKAELFRSGSSVFMENKSLKARYNDVLAEREKLLKTESALRRKLKEQDKELADLKKTVDDMYYQNIAIKANEDNENKRNAYVVVMGNEMVKTLEKEKSALYRRVKYLEKENDEIETRVNDLQKQSDSLISYTKIFEKPSNLAPVHQDNIADEKHRATYGFGPIPSQKALQYPAFEERKISPQQRGYSRDKERNQASAHKRRPYEDVLEDSASAPYRNYSRDHSYAQSHKVRPYQDYLEDRHSRAQLDDQIPQRGYSRDPHNDEQRFKRRNSTEPFFDDQKPPLSRNLITRGPFREAIEPFKQKPPRHAPTYETFDNNTSKSQDSHISLPRIDDSQSPRPTSHSSKGQSSRRATPSTLRK